jgi:ER lumen protein retaining receptor
LWIGDSSWFSSIFVSGISVKTQELWLLVFVVRYLIVDVYLYFIDVDIEDLRVDVTNPILKILYIASTASIVVGIKHTEPFKSVYNAQQDSFSHWKWCVFPSALLAYGTVVATDPTPDKAHFLVLYTEEWVGVVFVFSLFLEAVAILPQLEVLRKYRLVENLTGRFVLCLGLYRFLYVIDWIYIGEVERRNGRTVTQIWLLVPGITQIGLYGRFFWEYTLASRSNNDDCWEPVCGWVARFSSEIHSSRRLVFELAAAANSKGGGRSSREERIVKQPLFLAVGGDENDEVGRSPDGSDLLRHRAGIGP